MADDFVQTIVIGAGVVGLACAAALADSGREVLVLERESAIGQGVSSRNSEVIHTGIYYPAQSLRAAVCVQGRELLYRYCQSRGIAARRIGKLIVASSADEVPRMHTIAAGARRNGVDDLQILDRAGARHLEPELHCHAAIHSPSTGIVDSHHLMLSLQGDLQNAGGMVVLNTPVIDADCRRQPYQVRTGGDDGMLIHCNELINCAGLGAVDFAHRIAGLETTTIPGARFARGNYFRLQGKAPFSRLIYPVPVRGGLGVHLTLDLAGQARFGPDVEFLPDQYPADGQFSFRVDAQRSKSFYEAIRRYWPALPNDALVPDYAGVRPKITRPGDAEVDFEIATAQQHGIAGLINLYGIESPGLTSSLALARLVVSQLAGDDQNRTSRRPTAG